MITKRIGNDIPIEWTIIRCGEPEDLVGKRFSLYLYSFAGKVEIEDYVVSGNRIRFVFQGAQQIYAGIYGLLLVENEGEDGMYTIDHCQAFKLISHGCGECECSDGITVTSDIAIPANGLSAYQIALKNGYEGTEEEWIASLKQPALDAADAALKAEEKIKETEQEILKSESMRKSSEDERVKNENQRLSNEEARKNSEIDRDEAEQQRSASEDGRIKAESARKSSEEGRVIAESARKSSEEGRVIAEESRVKAEQQRVNKFSSMKSENESAVKKAGEAADAASKAAQSALTAAETADAASDKAEKAATAATTAAAAANGAAELANQNILALQLDPESGELSAIVGADGSAFDSGEILETGDIVLNFDYQDN